MPGDLRPIQQTYLSWAVLNAVISNILMTS